jgi:hypothetical protein
MDGRLQFLQGRGKRFIHSEHPVVRKSKVAVRNALLLLACIVVFLVGAVIIANFLG